MARFPKAERKEMYMFPTGIAVEGSRYTWWLERLMIRKKHALWPFEYRKLVKAGTAPELTRKLKKLLENVDKLPPGSTKVLLGFSSKACMGSTIAFVMSLDHCRGFLAQLTKQELSYNASSKY